MTERQFLINILDVTLACSKSLNLSYHRGLDRVNSR